jgi:3-hydroxyisobutyrate dehydrogenase
MSTPIATVAFIGFGEAGRIFARDLRAAGVRDIRAFDIAFADPRAPQLLAAREAGVRIAPAPRDAVAGADLVISAVTAGSDLDAARSCAGALEPAALFVDINSVAPQTKAAAQRIVDGAGGRYVEAAVMAPVQPRGLGTPMLLGGRHAAEFVRRAAGWPLDARVFSERIGAASSVKMCRSIMIKGLEALAIECAMTAHRYDVLPAVLESLADTFPGQDWNAKTRYLVSRALVHGRRRAEEMREVARTIEDAGLAPVMTRSTVAKQDWAADLGAIMGSARADSAELGALLADLDAACQRLPAQDKSAAVGQ